MSTIAIFWRDFCRTFVRHIFTAFLNILVAVLIARYWGVNAKGSFYILTTLCGFLVTFGNFGISAANVYFIGREQNLTSDIATNSLWLAFINGVICVILVFYLALAYPHFIIKGMDLFLLVIVLCSIPSQFFIEFSNQILLGLSKISSFNWLNLFFSLSFALTVGILVFMERTVTNLLLGYVSVFAIFFLIYVIYLRKIVHFACIFHWSLFLRMLRYGVRSYAACVLGFLVIHLNIFFVNYFLGLETAGVYSVVLDFADRLYVFPGLFGLLIFSYFSKLNVNISIQELLRHAVLVMSFLIIVTGIVFPFMVKFLYGSSFIGAVLPFALLLPGIFCSSISTILMQYFASQGLPPVVYTAQFFALLVNVTCNLLLAPRLGMVGVSLASSIAYGVLLWCALHYFLNSTKTKFSEVMCIRPKEIVRLFRLLRVS